MMAFVCAMLSNVLFATRGVLSKPLMKTISGSDLFAINTFLAFLIMAPITIALEGAVIVKGPPLTTPLCSFDDPPVPLRSPFDDPPFFAFEAPL